MRCQYGFAPDLEKGCTMQAPMGALSLVARVRDTSQPVRVFER
jgi:hypothetical protein